VIEWNDGKLTDEQVAAMSDEEISTRMDEFQTRLADLRHKQQILLEVLATKDPELAAEMRKQMKL